MSIQSLKNVKFIFLVLYIDDILLASSDVSLLLETKKFDMKDLDEASFVLGIETHRDRRKKGIRTVTKGIHGKDLKEI